VSASYPIAWCDRCAFGSIVPRPSADAISTFYDVETYYTHEHEQEQHAEDRRLLNRLRLRLAWQFDRGVQLDQQWFHARFGMSGARFCDIGCGAGGLLDIIRKAGHEAIGVDPDPAARQWAADLGLTVLEGMAEQIPASLSGEQFDAVLMTHTLEHCQDSVQAMTNALALVKPGGLLVVETPNNECAACALYGACWLHLDAPRHLNFFTEQSLRLVSERAGGHVDGFEYAGYTRQFLGDILRQQEQIWTCFRKLNGGASAEPSLREPTNSMAWTLLRRTLFAGERGKYDSVRILVRKS